MNYDIMMEKEIEKLKGEKPRLLLHACCAPCSSAVLERISDSFKISILYYNPNITEEREYQKRLEELKRFLLSFDKKKEIKVIDGRYQPEEFFEMSKGLEQEKERGKRCYLCYQMRLKEAAKLAKELGFDYFTTTLSLSPHKNSNWINEIGETLAKDYQISFLYSDFKKKNGYKKSIELSKLYHLYRQDYCGCIYSKREKQKKEVEVARN